jgi:hypothetical protein
MKGCWEGRIYERYQMCEMFSWVRTCECILMYYRQMELVARLLIRFVIPVDNEITMPAPLQMSRTPWLVEWPQLRLNSTLQPSVK